jgi:hypothetical protein
VRQAAKAPSFREASEDLRELAGLAVSPSHLQRLSDRIGREWAAARDADVAAFRGGGCRPHGRSRPGRPR